MNKTKQHRTNYDKYPLLYMENTAMLLIPEKISSGMVNAPHLNQGVSKGTNKESVSCFRVHRVREGQLAAGLTLTSRHAFSMHCIR